MSEPSRSSSDEASDWHLVEVDGTPSASPRAMSPRGPTNLTAEQLHSMATALGPLLESELLADHLLGQPFDASSGAGAHIEPVTTLQAAMDQQAAQNFQTPEVDDVGGAILESVERALSFQSGSRVDSLDGYTESERAELFEAGPEDEDDGFGSFAAIAARVTKMFNGVITEIGVELSGLSNTLGSAASVVVLQVLHIKNQAVGAGCSLRNACCQVFKDKGYPPLWVLSLGSLTTLAAAALVAQLYSNNKRLTLQLRQRDRELARLVIKILHLQDALHSAPRAVPVLRHNVQQLLLS